MKRDSKAEDLKYDVIEETEAKIISKQNDPS